MSVIYISDNDNNLATGRRLQRVTAKLNELKEHEAIAYKYLEVHRKACEEVIQMLEGLTPSERKYIEIWYTENE